jgi:hypothetical protein
MSLSPLFGGNLFSVAFGRNMDAHERTSSPTPMPPPPKVPPRQCLEGLEGYVDSLLYFTIPACVVALVLSIWAAWRDRKKAAETDRYRTLPDVIWEEEEGTLDGR